MQKARSIVCLCLLGLIWVGCKSVAQKKAEAPYGPTESVLEVVAVLRRYVPDDTYRFPPPTDFTGRNAYRSTLLRLESIESIHANALRSGYMKPVVHFSKGRSLERLRAYDLAQNQYLEVAKLDSPLKEEAQHSAEVCGRIHEAVLIGIQDPNPMNEGEKVSQEAADQTPEEVTQALEERVALLAFLKDEEKGSHYQYVISEEIERADQTRAAWFVNNRYRIPDGQLRALAELQRVVRRHPGSKNRLEHMLALAELYDDLAHEYVDAVPPASLNFDPALFQDLVDPATQIYESVAAHDGTTQKLEAARRLEAFLAFTLTVDRDRFTH